MAAVFTSTGQPGFVAPVSTFKRIDEMLLGWAVGQRVKEKCARREIDHGCAGDANRIDVPALKTGSNSCTNVALPDYSAGQRIERINIIGFGDRNDHRSIWAALDVKGLGVNIAGDRAVEVQVARQVRCRGRRKLSVNVNAVSGRIVVFLRDVDLRVSLDATQHGKAENRNYRSQSYAVSRHLGMRVRSSPSRYLNTFECLRCTLGT